MQDVAVILGDGVGPELVKATMRVVTATGAPVNMILCQAGSDWYESHAGDSLIPDETRDVINSTQACFKGPTTTPGGHGSPRSVAVTIRQEMDLYANVRPIKTFANTPRPLGDVDFVCVREATEGMYLSLIHISEPTRQAEISYAVFCLKKKKNEHRNINAKG